MGLLDGLVKAGLGKVLGGGSSDNGMQNQLIEIVLKQVLGNQNEGGVGGIGNLVNMMQNNGMGDIINSWVGSGANQQIDAEQIKQGFDSNILANIASQLGASESETAGQLGQILPGIIDQLTPKGQADDGLGLDDAISMLGGLLK